MRSRAEIEAEINRLSLEIEAITVGGVPVEGYETEYEDLQQRLATLREQYSQDEAPLPRGRPSRSSLPRPWQPWTRRGDTLTSARTI
jgi:hypothetical protein